MGGIYETLSGAKGLRAEGKSARNIAEYNAKVAEQEGNAALLRSEFDQMQQAKEAERIKGRLRAGLGSAGGLGSKVATDILGEQAEESELENLLIGYGGQTAKSRSESQATGLRLEGQLAYERGKAAARSANIQFGMQLASMAVGMPGVGSAAAGAGKSFLSGLGNVGRGIGSAFSGGGKLASGSKTMFDLNAGVPSYGRILA